MIIEDQGRGSSVYGRSFGRSFNAKHCASLLRALVATRNRTRSGHRVRNGRGASRRTLSLQNQEIAFDWIRLKIMANT